MLEKIQRPSIPKGAVDCKARFPQIETVEFLRLKRGYALSPQFNLLYYNNNIEIYLNEVTC